MNENINLCEILKGHEGETFYSPCYGYITLKLIKPHCYFSLFFDDNNSEYKFTKHGKISTSNDAECVLFSSKDQRDWNKWVEEQKPKVPKTWSDIKEEEKFQGNAAIVVNKEELIETPIIKSTNALLKIHQLIEVGYGGNAIKTPDNNTICIIYDFHTNMFMVNVCSSLWRSHIIFHTKEQAEEFLKYPENIQLLKDYFMI